MFLLGPLRKTPILRIDLLRVIRQPSRNNCLSAPTAGFPVWALHGDEGEAHSEGRNMTGTRTSQMYVMLAVSAIASQEVKGGLGVNQKKLQEGSECISNDHLLTSWYTAPPLYRPVGAHLAKCIYFHSTSFFFLCIPDFLIIIASLSVCKGTSLYTN